jgi:hypothetical protein
MIARGEGPKVTQISPKRKGIRDSHRNKYLEARATLSKAERQAERNIRGAGAARNPDKNDVAV